MGKWAVLHYKKCYDRDFVDYFDNKEIAMEWYNRLKGIYPKSTYPKDRIEIYEEMENETI